MLTIMVTSYFWCIHLLSFSLDTPLHSNEFQGGCPVISNLTAQLPEICCSKFFIMLYCYTPLQDNI